MFIAVIGGERCDANACRLAEAVGRELAKRGATLVCGGGGGVMEAACRGARSAGGVTIGILPGNKRAAANEYVTIPIVTGLGFARNSIVVKSAQAIIAVDGAYGTLSEIAYALISGIPIVGLGTWEVSIDGKKDDCIIRVDDPVDAVETALALAAGETQTCGNGGSTQ
ncbi:MAG: TIGR00725 family protein [Chloroflexi bacterium]|nr:TIGR00725 family protein [Chloroflexota bacterium]